MENIKDKKPGFGKQPFNASPFGGPDYEPIPEDVLKDCPVIDGKCSLGSECLFWNRKAARCAHPLEQELTNDEDRGKLPW